MSNKLWQFQFYNSICMTHVQDNIRSTVNKGNDRMGSFYPSSSSSATSTAPPLCLGLQRRASVSGLNWSVRRCGAHGGYVCKRQKSTTRQSVMQNQTVVGSEGRLTSPGYPNAYPPNVDYSVKISGPERSRLIVQFQKLDLEFQDQCMYDYVSIRDYRATERRPDPGTNSVPLAMFHAPEQSDRWWEEGFRAPPFRALRYDTESDNVQGDMGSWRKSRRKRSRTMSNSPPNGIQGPGSETVSGPSFKPYLRFCGEFDANMSRFDFISRGNQAVLHFHSDYAGGGTGFAAIWTAVDVTGCPMQTITSREGVIQSPNHPYFLLNNLECTYVVQAPLGRKVWIEFTDFDVRDDALVTVDLGDGYGELQPFANHRVHTDGSYLSASEKFRISLRTGASPEGRGFKLAFRTVGECAMYFNLA